MASNIIQSWSDQERPWTELGSTPDGGTILVQPAELRIHLWPHAALTTVCEPLKPSEFGAALEEIGQTMRQLMHLKGIGLAANQVGITKRFFVMKMPDHSVELMCNPVIVRKSDKLQGGLEGCLSLPGVTGTVLRSTSIQLHYQTSDGDHRERDLHDLYARCAQHEIEHLDGKMFFTDASRQIRRGVEREWAKMKPRAIAGKYKGIPYEV